jgi:phenylalanyl-tRNA synthetase beta subunit
VGRRELGRAIAGRVEQVAGEDGEAVRRGVRAGVLCRGGVEAAAEPDGGLVVTVPVGRSDVDNPETVAGEVARLRGGYRTLPATAPVPIPPPRPDRARRVRELTREAAIRCGSGSVPC